MSPSNPPLGEAVPEVTFLNLTTPVVFTDINLESFEEDINPSSLNGFTDDEMCNLLVGNITGPKPIDPLISNTGAVVFPIVELFVNLTIVLVVPLKSVLVPLVPLDPV
jgi:hypothetical protein